MLRLLFGLDKVAALGDKGGGFLEVALDGGRAVCHHRGVNVSVAFLLQEHKLLNRRRACTTPGNRAARAVARVHARKQERGARAVR